MPTDPQGTTGAGLRLTPQLLLGLMVIAVGVVLMLDNLGIAPCPVSSDIGRWR